MEYFMVAKIFRHFVEEFWLDGIDNASNRIHNSAYKQPHKSLDW